MNEKQGFSYKEYKELKHGDYQSVGMFGDSIYAYEQLTGFASIPEYRQITKREFETFEEWSKEEPSEHGILFDIRERELLCSAHKDQTESKEIQMEVTCPVCNTIFLLPKDDVPEQEDLYIVCPTCNKPVDQKLMDEVKAQLKRTDLTIEGLVSVLQTNYMNPKQYHEGRGYVNIVGEEFELFTHKNGKSVKEHTSSDLQEAAYFILLQLLPSVENKKFESEQNEKKREKKVTKALEIEFAKLDECYSKWFLEKHFLKK